MNIIVFDVDETLGAFYEFSLFCNNAVQNTKLTYPLFRYLLDSNPKFLQPNILSVLQHIRRHKNENCKVAMFTNNQGHPTWIQFIKLYLHEKIGYELFDKVVYAKKYEPKRKQESKCLNDFWSCTQYPPNSKILFVDDQKHPLMLACNVTYINVPAYKTNTPKDISIYLLEFIDEFLDI